MMIRPSLIEAKQFDTRQYRMIPMSMEMYSDSVTPIGVLKILRSVSQHCFILESAEDTQHWGRYTFLGFSPTLAMTCRDGVVKVRNHCTGTPSPLRNSGTLSSGGEVHETFVTTDPSRVIQEILEKCKSPRLDYLPPFAGGLVGYFSYDYVKYSEPALRLDSEDSEQFNDVDLMLFDKVIAFDNYRQKIILIVNVKAENVEAEYSKGIAELNALKTLIEGGVPSFIRANGNASAPVSPTPARSSGSGRGGSPALSGDAFALPLKALFSEKEFCQMVEKAKEYIAKGELGQIVLSNRLEADFEGSLLDTYRVLRTINPSPYMFYLGGDDVEIAGASPETLMKLKDGKLYTFPLGGTRRRGETEEEDIALEKELLADKKELSEHEMLVDCGKDDLGKVCKEGTVGVEKYRAILRFSHVMHIGSTVCGEIREDKNGLDALNAILPAGTLSGAPKIRSMQIINELENCKRGIYGGAIGYLDFAGNMDTCIAIRIAYKKNGKVFIRSGAGVVAESVAESEYKECVNKAKAVVKALQLAEGGIH